MEFNPFPVALPAIIALAVKIIIFSYARLSPTHNLQTRLFLWALFALAIQDLAAVDIVYSVAQGNLSLLSFTLFYATSIAALSLFFHLAVCVSINNHWPKSSLASVCFVYLYAFMLFLLLFFTDSLLRGAVATDYMLSKVPGYLFWLLEIYIVGISIGLLSLFSYGSLRQDTAAGRAKNALLLAGMFPVLVVLIALSSLLQVDIKWANATTVMPFAITLFIVVSAYAIYQHRIFNIQIFIPWSKTRRRKTAFHRGVRRLIAEIADLPSASQIVQRLSDTLRCPVALLGPNKPLFAGDAARKMANLPADELAKIDQIVVAQEIAESSPHMHAAMASNGVAAIVPFYPHSENIAGWLLLGDSFNEQVHSPLDFQLVEELFGKMAELFIDRFVTLRSQLRAANKQLRALAVHNETLQDQIAALQKKLPTNDLPILTYETSIAQVAQSPSQLLTTPVTYLGRDKTTCAALKQTFRAAETFVGPGSVAFQRSNNHGIVVYHAIDSSPKLNKCFCRRKFPAPTLLYGPQVKACVQAVQSTMNNALVDVVPGNPHPHLLCNRVHALMHLQRHLYSSSLTEEPLLGVGSVFTAFIQHLRMLAKLRDPVLLVYDDIGLAWSAVHYLHQYAGAAGEVVRATRADLEQAKPARDTVALIDLQHHGSTEQNSIARLMHNRDQTSARLIVGCHYDALEDLDERIRILTQGFSLEVPRLHERREDIPLLVHYYTLLLNFSACAFRSLTRAEVNSLQLHEPGWTLQGLRRATVEFLVKKTAADGEYNPDFSPTDNLDLIKQEQSLDELVAEFESRIIMQTLEKCEGNKSKTARMLGLRPNTLHYKLERYGVNSAKRGRRTKTAELDQTGPS